MPEVEESCFLYMITNKVNGKSYIGVSNNPARRMREHIRENRPNSNPHLKASVSKYGADNFEMKILCEGSREYIYDLEAKAIELYDTLSNGYNQAPGGRGGLGKKIKKRSDDYNCFVSGFWFPNKRVACETLNITNTNVFYKKRKYETLGSIENKVKGCRSGHPVYFKGFWFENIEQASVIFSKTPTAILQSINNGKIEEYSRKFSAHPVRVPVIDGIYFKSLEDAAETLNISKYTLRSRFYIGTEGYSYQYIKE